MRDDGSGFVRVVVVADSEAVTAVESGGTKIDQAVRVSDLQSAGWRVGTWERAADGKNATLVLTHPFSSPEEVAQIFASASGKDGPLRTIHAERNKGITSTEYRVEGVADLENVKTGVPTDPELVQALGAQGVDVNVIDQQLLAQLKASFSLTLVVRLPDQKPIIIKATPGKVTKVDASSSVMQTERLLFAAAAVGFGVLAVIVWRQGRRHRRGRGRGRGRGRRPAAPSTTAKTAGSPRAPAPPPRRPPVPLDERDE